ncbi:MAG: adenylate/guanylate cyclase domain-containing protein [Gammaproteobacteria bacterium]|nr:adenylate/guanylate cyclase domain-containing protein [Gammaproteobacteria bacterium]
MTSRETLTYMAADIIGYSLLAQKDQHRILELIDSYRAILIPIIEKAGGTSIVCTADAVTACFSSCQSAARAGFDIQKALSVRNSSDTVSKLAVRIGLHNSRPGDKGHLQQLSMTLASSLESFGDARALCVSLPVLKELKDVSWLHSYTLGSRCLDYLPDPQKIFYLYKNKPGSFIRLGMQLKFLKYEYLDRFKFSYSLAVSMSAVIIAAALWINTTADNSVNIKFSNVIDLSQEEHKSDLSSLTRLIRFRLASISTVTDRNTSSVPDTRLICSFQQHGEMVRLTWGFLDGSDETQISGGALSGNIADLDDLEKRLLEAVINQIEIRTSLLSNS